MKNQTKARLSPAQMREVLLANAQVLMSELFQTRSPEVSGLKKTEQQSVDAPLQKRSTSYP
ncbi:hypothetical protein EDF81_1360 [Enterobacter sp. BIGb0383]|nr:hypothetical protein EDF81_1360 [Enterobacter sp. BIGb0383]ROS13010.1 hypothetical protein EC848_1362 [Enterobacter sp. BIGb0359]